MGPPPIPWPLSPSPQRRIPRWDPGGVGVGRHPAGLHPGTAGAGRALLLGLSASSLTQRARRLAQPNGDRGGPAEAPRRGQRVSWAGVALLGATAVRALPDGNLYLGARDPGNAVISPNH